MRTTCGVELWAVLLYFVIIQISINRVTYMGKERLGWLVPSIGAGKLSVAGCPAWMKVELGVTVLAEGAVRVVWPFFSQLSYLFSWEGSI